MDPNKLLEEVQRERATFWKKLKWFWFGRCLKCGGKLVVGYWYVAGYRSYPFNYYLSPRCEWCLALNAPMEDRIYKTAKWRQIVIYVILLLVLLLVIRILIK